MTEPSWSGFVLLQSFFVLESAEQEALVQNMLGRLAGKGKSGGPWLSKLLLGRSARCSRLRLFGQDQDALSRHGSEEYEGIFFPQKIEKIVLINDVTFTMGFSSTSPQLLLVQLHDEQFRCWAFPPRLVWCCCGKGYRLFTDFCSTVLLAQPTPSCGHGSHPYQLFSSISGHDLDAACIYLLHNAWHVVEHGRLQETACRVGAGM